MGIRAVESSILHAAREHFDNPKLRLRDLCEWSTGKLEPKSEYEIAEFVPAAGVWVVINRAYDLRIRKVAQP
jgi:hypothetical protein